MKLFIRGYKGRGAGSGLIKWFTRGDYSHNSLVFEFNDRREEVESIQGSGVIKHEPVPFENADFDEYLIPVSDAQVRKAYKLSSSLLGAKYDWSGIAGFLLRSKKLTDEKWFCSELAAYVCYKVGYPLSRRQPWRETPSTNMESFRCEVPAIKL